MQKVPNPVNFIGPHDSQAIETTDSHLVRRCELCEKREKFAISLLTAQRVAYIVDISTVECSSVLKGFIVTPTIRDVAKRAGVNASTVSRVVSGTGKISDATQQRVWESVAYLGWKPNALARSLSRQASGTLGLVIPDMAKQSFADPFFPQLIRGLLATAHATGYRLILSGSDTWPDGISQSQDLLNSKTADGIVLVLTTTLDNATLHDLRRTERPFVLIGRPLETIKNVTWVDVDKEAAIYEALQYLISLGHRQIGFIAGLADSMSTRQRIIGYRRALSHAGIPHNDEMIAFGGYSEEGAATATAILLTRSPTAIYAESDLMAVAALSVIKQAGLRVPNDISLVGCNDDTIAQHLTPPLTTTRIPIADLAAEATRLLIDQIEGKIINAVSRLLPYQLIVRASVAEVR